MDIYKFKIQSILWAIIIGMLSSELFILIKHLGTIVINSNKMEYISFLIFIYFLTFIISIAFSFDSWKLLAKNVLKIIRSIRIDLLISLAFGIYIIYIYDGFNIKELKILEKMDVKIIFSMFLFPSLIIIFRIIYEYALKNKRFQKKESKFYSDSPIEYISEDGYCLRNKVKTFSESVYDNGSSNNIVFGLDAPWGTGKTSFINLCKEYLESKHREQVIIYRFNATLYQKEEDVYQKLLYGIVSEIKKYYFCPELKPIVNDYIKVLNANIEYFGISIPLSFNIDNNNLKEQIQEIVNKINKKVIIVIDDLDRLNFKTMQRILYSIKQAFSFENVSYILCYDTENLLLLSKRKGSKKKRLEFFEKYINIKFSLFMEANTLIDNAIKKSNEKSEEKLTSTIFENIQEIMRNTNSSIWNGYLQFLSDYRKIKKLINLIIVLDLNNVELSNYDINAISLLNLILIYQNYPRLFNKIIQTETNGKRGYFSILNWLDEDYPKDSESGLFENEAKYKNSKSFTKLIGSKSLEQGEKFLLNRTFKLTDNKTVLDFSEMEKRTLPFINGNILGNLNRNLEKYIKLIIDGVLPDIEAEYITYVKYASEIAKGKSIKDFFDTKTDLCGNEEIHDLIFSILTNSKANMLTDEKNEEIINYIIDNLSKYSRISQKEGYHNIRHNFIFFLTKTINNFGFSKLGDNPIILNQIHDRIYGKNTYESHGIIDRLFNNTKIVLALENVVSFKNICINSRNNFFNIEDSLSRNTDSHSDNFPNKIFEFFNKEFIESKNNIFCKIDELKKNDFIGNFRECITIEEEELTDLIEIEKNEMKKDLIIEIMFQDYKNDKISEINKSKISEHLFNTCFDRSADSENYKHFINYVIITSGYVDIDHERKFMLSNILNTLDEEELKKYWEKNREFIKAQNYDKVLEQISNKRDTFILSEVLKIMYDSYDELIS